MTLVSAWVAFTIFAALMQAVRTAGQKHLASSVSPMSSTLIRYVFGLPFAIIYWLFVTKPELSGDMAAIFDNTRFVGFALLAAVAQIVATFLLIKSFSYRNFTVGTSLAKTEAVQAAVFGTVLFGIPLSMTGWLAVAIGFLGIFIVSMPAGEQRWESTSVLLGTLSGSAFALTSLWLRQASLSLDMSVLASAATTLVFMVSIQSVICLIYTVLREPSELRNICRHLWLAGFVGLTSALGSVGWFTAMTYQNPALVKSLGQVEFIFTLLLTTLFFKERVTARELFGVCAIVTSVILIVRTH
ncbi:MAG: DMT family transporter [Granulosicoccus sp.]|nr:DMT family transporter [Granulosicoccus sp.]